MPTARVTSKGRVTLPREIREALWIRPGDRVDFFLGEDGEARLRAGEVDVGERRGFLHRPGRPTVSLKAMRGCR